VQLLNNAILSFVTSLRKERGQDLLEYAMLGGLIAAALVIVFGVLIGGGVIDKMATGIGNCIDFDDGTGCTGGL
jgi:Flp pilus assembly pilin Flp